MRQVASVLHLDLDAFFAAVEQRDKPSLRGKPVVVGGVGGRGVVSTASYEARKYGVRSAMSTREARSRCPHAAFLTGRFHAYRTASEQVMAVLRETSRWWSRCRSTRPSSTWRWRSWTTSRSTVTAVAERLREQVTEVTGGLTASVGVGTSKFIAKVASDLDKPDGLVRRAPGTEMDLLRPMHVSVIPGVGPATTERLRRAGIHTVADLESVSEDALVRMLGTAHGHSLHHLGHARDDRPVVPERETKSVSVEGTYDTDLTDRRLMAALLTRQARSVADRLRASGLAGRTVTIKVRLHDFTTISRSTTLGSPTDAAGTIGRLAVGLLQDLETTGRRAPARRRRLRAGRLDPGGPVRRDRRRRGRSRCRSRPRGSLVGRAKATTHSWAPGMDVEHATLGRGWVWGSGRGVVTVRFETAETDPGAVRAPDRRPRPQTLATGVGRRDYSPGHARTTSLTTPSGHSAARLLARRVVAYAALREFIPVFPVYALLFTDAGLLHRPGLDASWGHLVGVPRRPGERCPSGAPGGRHRAAAAVLLIPGRGAVRLLLRPLLLGGPDVRRVRRWLRAVGPQRVAGVGDLRGVRVRPPARSGPTSYRKVIAAGETGALVLNLLATASATPIVAAWGLAGAGWASVAVCAAATLLAVGLPGDAPRSHLDPDARPGRRARPRVPGHVAGRPGRSPCTRASLAPCCSRPWVPAFLAFDEYFGLLAIGSIRVSLTAVPLLVALTVAAQGRRPRLGAASSVATGRGLVVVAAGLLVAAGAAVRGASRVRRRRHRVRRAAGRHHRAAGDLPPSIHGAARLTGDVGQRAAERGVIALYTFVAVVSGVASMPALITVLALLVVALGLVAARAYPATWRNPTGSPWLVLSALPQGPRGRRRPRPGTRLVVGWSARKTSGWPSGGTCTAPNTSPSLGSSSRRARATGSPASRSATRSESAATVQAPSASRRTPPLTQSARVPGAHGAARQPPPRGARRPGPRPTPRSDGQHLPVRQRRRAEPGQPVGGPRPQHLRHVQATRHRGDPAHPAAGGADQQHGARRQRDRFAPRRGAPVDEHVGRGSR